ncbi:hypothetical protein CC78DRAFT_531376 [Lojkania enalia]|uniref:Uncharacterized protein n=1 Tax=Lojkania enalia TaxID=147567 RepID=A0A9P4N8W7_9PLEO|nr:hypothetical protein CC78DRAFT_531376 [Didymosphaeria enalia]
MGHLTGGISLSGCHTHAYTHASPATVQVIARAKTVDVKTDPELPPKPVTVRSARCSVLDAVDAEATTVRHG